MRMLVPAFVPVAILGLVASLLVSREDDHPPRAHAPRHACARVSMPFAGAVVGSPQSRSLAKLAASGVRLDVVESYAAFGNPFDAGQADPAEAIHAVPVIQIDPRKVSLEAIASGRKDAYLRSYAESVRAFRCPIVLSFGHEMNGNWYSWGYHNSSSVAFVAAWRHIVNVFRSQHAYERDLDVDPQPVVPKHESDRPVPRNVVAGERLCQLGGHRRLLPQAVMELRLVVRGTIKAVRN